MVDKGLTPNLKLSQFTPDYKPGWSKDLNEDFSKIDIAVTKVDNESMKASIYDPQGEGRNIFKALDELIPAGVTLPYAGATAPSGFLLCQGQAVSRTTYARLFAAIGTLHGAGDGSTTFNVPDMRDKFPYGAGKNALGKIGGEEAHTLTKAELPAVIPDARQSSTGGTNTNASYIKFEYGATWTTSNNGFFPLGEGQPHNTIPPFVALNYIIKI